jgi:membrane associated rhomboid family serine protease
MLSQNHSSAIGASGCIFGLICSLVFTDPKSLVLTPGTPLPIPIFLFAPLYIINEVMQLGDTTSMVAHTAHIGGGLAGAAMGRLLITSSSSTGNPS